jgi:hypothetical protein
MRVLQAPATGAPVLEHRYETWVDYVSRPLAPRVDLEPLVPRLQALERRPGRWRAEPASAMTPRLYLADPEGRPSPSSLGPKRLAAELVAYLGDSRVAA